MNTRKVKLIAGALWAMGGGFAYAQVTPFNSGRALIIYTNAAVDSFGGAGVNFYQDYFAGIFDAMNQTYESSEVDERVQIAGVIWDKTYAQFYPNPETGYPGCDAVWDLIDSTRPNFMRRYVNLVERYAADMLILVHPIPPGGCGDFWGGVGAGGRGYGVFYVNTPTNALVWSHEIGHNHGADHCDGHRVTLNSDGVPLAGPLNYGADSVSFVTGDSLPLGPDRDYEVNDIVETEFGPANRGFYTTMAYSTPGACYTILDNARYVDTNTYGGERRRYRFHHHGVGHDLGSEGWTGTYSNPNLYWQDPGTSTWYPTGGNSMGYIRRLKYLSADTVTYRDTVYFPHNEKDTIQANYNILNNFQGVPSDLVLTSDMGLGPNAADSQWVYAHFSATESVVIQPGFHLAGGASMRISVGTSGGMLAKSAFKQPGDKNNRKGMVATSADFRVKYSPSAKAVSFSLGAGPASKVTAFVYNIRGGRKMQMVFQGTFSETISVSDLPDGVYLLRVVVDDKQFDRRFVKW